MVLKYEIPFWKIQSFYGINFAHLLEFIFNHKFNNGDKSWNNANNIASLSEI